MNTTYNPTGKFSWQFGEKMPGYNEWHKYLGPCPDCGSPCFDYGGGWRCLDYRCFRSANNPAPNVGAAPDWWNTNIVVKEDGHLWCAHLDDFVNLQESPSGFGTDPTAAVKNLRQNILV